MNNISCENGLSYVLSEVIKLQLQCLKFSQLQIV